MNAIRRYPSVQNCSQLRFDEERHQAANTKPEEPKAPERPCPCCGGRMRIIEAFLPGQHPKHHFTQLPRAIRIDTSRQPQSYHPEKPFTSAFKRSPEVQTMRSVLPLMTELGHP